VNSWKVILATIVIFGAGVFTGGLLVNQVKHPLIRRESSRPVTPAETLPPAVTPEFLKKQFIQQLSDKLDLSLQQSNQIQRIIDQGQQNTHDLWKLVAPQFQVVWHDTRQQIRDVLTPEQKKQFETLMKQQHAMHHQPATNAPPVAPSMPTNTPAI
jgi:hypothetical protein